jgi:hypothetical protein
MKKLIALSIISLFAFSAMAQKGKDKMAQQYREITSELNLNPEQEVAIKKLFEERRKARTPKEEGILTEEEKNQEKIDRMKARKESNRQFRTQLNSILDEEQQAKLKELMPAKKKGTMDEKESKPMHGHKHKAGEEHSH